MTKILVFLLGFILLAVESGQANSECNAIDSKRQENFNRNTNKFGVRLYRRARYEVNGSFVFSPWSISVALGMVMGGAKGDTLKQIKRQVGYGLKPEEIGPAFSYSINGIIPKFPNKNLVVYTANAMYVQKGFQLVRKFRHDYIDKCLEGEVKERDFKRRAEQVRKEVNAHIGNKTNNMIKDLLPQGSVDSMTRMILVNTLYMKLAWMHKFKKNDTKKDNFIVKGQKNLVDFMSQVGTFEYMEDKSIQVLGLPYVGYSMSLYILLPKHKDKLKLMEYHMTSKKSKSVFEMIKNTTPTGVAVKIPKFKIKFELAAKEILQKMGIKDMFSDKANLSGIAKKPLHVDNVYHQAVFEVNEQGTEASAATAAVAGLRSMPEPKTNPTKTFVADHPFAFVLYHQPSDSILFMGRVVDLK